MTAADRNAELARRYFWLWFAAAALAFIAAGIHFYRTGTLTASLLVPGFLCVLMGFVSRSRARRGPPR